MINKIMKRNGIKSLEKDLKRIDISKISLDVNFEKDISYIEDGLIGHMLDTYYIKDNVKKSVLIDIHGGGHISGDKALDQLFCNYMAQKGFVVFSINYRLAYPQFNVFDQIEDVSCAVNWILRNIENYNGNVNKMYIMGHSSGGVLAFSEALICKSKDMCIDYGLSRDTYDYNGIMIDCGLMNFYKKGVAYWGMRNMIFPMNYKKMKKYQNIIFEKNKDISKIPPVYLITNNTDEVKDMTYYFKSVLEKYKVCNKLNDKGDGGHMGVVFNPFSIANKKMIDDMLRFFE